MIYYLLIKVNKLIVLEIYLYLFHPLKGLELKLILEKCTYKE